jgi:hypothetical protein
MNNRCQVSHAVRRRSVLGALGALPLALSLPAMAAPKLPEVHVYKSPHCGCCTAWIDHMRAAGFTVRHTDVSDTSAARKRLGLPDTFGSCHTATVGGYAVEGHVPAAEVKRLLELKPDAIGLAVPGMPPGSPGMEVGARQDPYQVFLIDKGGSETVFASYPKR